MRNTLLLAFIFTVTLAQGQIKRFSIRVAANTPLIDDVTVKEDLISTLPWYMGTTGTNEIPPSQYSYKQSFKSKTGYDIAGSVEMTLRRKLTLTTGITLSVIRFRKEYGTDHGVATNIYIPAGSYHGSIREPSWGTGFQNPYPWLFQKEKTGETKILYLQVPLLFGTSLFHDKVFVRGGVNVSYSPYSSEYKLENTTTDYKDTSHENIRKTLVSATANVIYYIIPRLGLDVTASRSLSSIYTSNTVNFVNLSLGVMYSFN